MHFVEGQFVRLWSGEAQRGQCEMDVGISISFDTDGVGGGEECKF